MPKKEILKNDLLTVRVDAEPVVETVESVAKEVLDLSEEALDAIENTAEKVVTVTKNNPYLIAGVALVALTSGAALGYMYAKKKLVTQYDQILEEQIESTKNYYTRLNKREQFKTPAEAVEVLVPEEERDEKVDTAAAALLAYQGEKVDEERVTEVVSNIFVDSIPVDDNFDYSEEMKDRDPEMPYVISREEYMENVSENEQSTLSYFAGDDVLLDEKEEIINDSDTVVGNQNLLRFGHGSKDNNTVYVRNEKLELDFEIVKSEGKYSEEVLGFIEHSDDRRKIRRFRGEDE